MRYDLVVVGASWGGLAALQAILRVLPGDFAAPMVVTQHRSARSDDTVLPMLLDANTPLTVRDAEDKDTLERGTVLIAPPEEGGKERVVSARRTVLGDADRRDEVAVEPAQERLQGGETAPRGPDRDQIAAHQPRRRKSFSAGSSDSYRSAISASEIASLRPSPR